MFLLKLHAKKKMKWELKCSVQTKKDKFTAHLFLVKFKDLMIYDKLFSPFVFKLFMSFSPYFKKSLTLKKCFLSAVAPFFLYICNCSFSTVLQKDLENVRFDFFYMENLWQKMTQKFYKSAHKEHEGVNKCRCRGKIIWGFYCRFETLLSLLKLWDFWLFLRRHLSFHLILLTSRRNNWDVQSRSHVWLHFLTVA